MSYASTSIRFPLSPSAEAARRTCMMFPAASASPIFGASSGLICVLCAAPSRTRLASYARLAAVCFSPPAVLFSPPVVLFSTP